MLSFPTDRALRTQKGTRSSVDAKLNSIVLTLKSVSISMGGELAFISVSYWVTLNPLSEHS